MNVDFLTQRRRGRKGSQRFYESRRDDIFVTKQTNNKIKLRRCGILKKNGEKGVAPTELFSLGFIGVTKLSLLRSCRREMRRDTTREEMRGKGDTETREKGDKERGCGGEGKRRHGERVQKGFVGREWLRDETFPASFHVPPFVDWRAGFAPLNHSRPTICRSFIWRSFCEFSRTKNRYESVNKNASKQIGLFAVF